MFHVSGFMFQERGFSFIDVLVGIALLAVVFLGIVGAYRLAVKVVAQSKNRTAATAIASGQMELIRNLPYESIGVAGSFPDGELPNSTTTQMNNTEYLIENRVDFVADPIDGLVSPDDECPNDYKKAEVKVSWFGLHQGDVMLTTDIAPQNLSQECGTGGGILKVSVFDAFGAMVPTPLIEIKDPDTGSVLKSAVPTSGEHYFSLATSTYRADVSKSGFSAERTYSTSEIAAPEKPNPIVLENQLTGISFSIDELSSFSVDTLSLWGQDSFADSFINETKISESFNTVVRPGEAVLASTSDGHVLSGYLVSNPIIPISLNAWDELTWIDIEPLYTDLKYQLYFATSSDYLIVPDTDLAGNEQGFDLSPVDLSGLNIVSYPKLKIRANFSTTATSSTPVLDNYQLAWITSSATPISNVSFRLQSEKIIGTDSAENPVYKYAATSTSNALGQVDISDLEWDNYTFIVYPSSELDLIDIDPAPQPIALTPDTILPVDLFLQAENSLLITLQNSETLESIFSGTVRAYNGSLSYDRTQYTDTNGQTYFIPLNNDNYTLEIEAPSYAPATTTVSVLGDTIKTIRLDQIE